MDADLHWYAVKVFYRRVAEVEKAVAEAGYETYVPTHIVQENEGGKSRTKREPLVSGLLFVRATAQYIKDFQFQFYGKAMLYRNAEKKALAVIPDREMEAFKFVTSAGDKGLELISIPPGELPGTRVRVIGGMFEGAEGYIRRVDHRKRFFVVLEGIVAVATSYIPAQWLEAIAEKS